MSALTKSRKPSCKADSLSNTTTLYYSFEHCACVLSDCPDVVFLDSDLSMRDWMNDGRKGGWGHPVNRDAKYVLYYDHKGFIVRCDYNPGPDTGLKEETANEKLARYEREDENRRMEARNTYTEHKRRKKGRTNVNQLWGQAIR